MPVEPLELIDGVPAIELEVEEAAAVGVGITAIDFFPVLVVLGMVAAATAWLRPLLKGQHSAHHSLLYRVVTWPASKLLHGLKLIEARVLHALSHWLAPKLRPVTHFLRSTTHLLHLLAQDVGDLADNTHEALVYLRHHVIPQLIRQATRPLAVAIATVGAELDALESRLQRAAESVANIFEDAGIFIERNMVGALSALAALVVGLQHEVYEVLQPAVTFVTETALPAIRHRLTVVETAITETIPQEFRNLNTRLQELQDYILSAAFIAAVVLAVEKALEYLTCRNMKTMGNEACAFEENAMRDLLGLMFGAIALADLRELTRTAQGFERAVGGVIKDVLDA